MTLNRVAAASSAMLLAASLFAAPAVASTVSSTMFTDVNGHWARPTIERLGSLGLVTGFEGKARPDEPMSRAEFVTILLRAMDIRSNPQAPVTFSDIQGHWAKETIATAAQLQMVNGLGAGRFGPEDNITRDALAKLLTTDTSTLEKETTALPPFRDITGNWGQSFIITAYQSGLVKGKDGIYYYRPTLEATRAEAFVMIERMLEKQTKGTLPARATVDSLVTMVNQSTQAFLTGSVPAGLSQNFTGPMQPFIERAEKQQTGLPAGLPPRGAVWEEAHAMTVAQNYIKIRTTTSTPGSDGERAYQAWDVYLIKKGGQWKIGDYAAVSQ